MLSNKQTGSYSKIYRNCFYVPYEERTLRNPWVKSFSCIKMTSRGDELKAQLETLRYFPESTIDNVKELVELVQSLSATTKTFVSQVVVLAKIVLVSQWVIIFCHEAGKNVLRFYHLWLPTEPFAGRSCPKRQNRQLEWLIVINEIRKISRKQLDFAKLTEARSEIS